MEVQETLQPFLLDGIRQVGSTIGDGSYASSVVPLSFRGLKCAGKRPFHTTLYDSASLQERERMLERFQEECQLLNRLKHPNIVQFLGVHFEEDIPVLVMEFLHLTLSENLERYGVMEERVSLTILEDVAMGLCYLHGHQPTIVHGGLSANSVLLTSDMRAKISDVGMTKILNLSPSRMSQLTECPGKPPYMPPEALEEDLEYSTNCKYKTDCFSMGVMILHVLCGKLPIPIHSRIHKGKQLSEVELRERYLQTVESDHPLVELIHSCLENDPLQRPTAEQILCQLRQALKISVTVNESYGCVDHPDPMENEGYYYCIDEEEKSPTPSKQHLEIHELSQSLKRQMKLELAHSIEMEQELCSETEGPRAVVKSKEVVEEKEIKKQQTNEETMKTMEAVEKEKQQAIQANEMEIQQALQAMETEKQLAFKEMKTEKEQAIKIMKAEKQRAIQDMEALVQLKEKQIEEKKLQLSASSLLFQLYTLTSLGRLHWSWKKLADMPVPMKWPQSVLIHENAFVASRSNNHNVLKYDTKSDQWSVLPPCPVMNFGLGQLSGKLIAVGGCAKIESLSGLLGSCGVSEINHSIGNVYTYDEESQQWENVIPPMPTPRALSNVVTCGSIFAACGGVGKNRLVEVFKSKKKGKWFTGASLPDACSYTQVAVVNDRCYLGGGGLFISNRFLMSASLPRLVQSHTLPYCQKSSEVSSAQHQPVWTKCQMPHYGSALASMGEVLLALGGCKYPISNSSSLCNDDIHAYCPSTESWIKIGCLPHACCSATAEQLPSGEVLLIGGTDSQGNDIMAAHIQRHV